MHSRRLVTGGGDVSRDRGRQAGDWGKTAVSSGVSERRDAAMKIEKQVCVSCRQELQALLCWEQQRAARFMSPTLSSLPTSLLSSSSLPPSPSPHHLHFFHLFPLAAPQVHMRKPSVNSRHGARWPPCCSGPKLGSLVKLSHAHASPRHDHVAHPSRWIPYGASKTT